MVLYTFINILIRNYDDDHDDENINKRMCDMNDLFLIVFTITSFSTYWLNSENYIQLLYSTFMIIAMYLIYFILLYLLIKFFPKNSHWKK